MNSIIKLLIFATVICCNNLAFGQIDSINLCIGSAKDLDCPSTTRTVCGCDGVTYANECLGREKGVQSFVSGACGTKGKPVREDCIGEISREVCSDPPRPVCGCDGVTYENACRARFAGVQKTTAGPCNGTNAGGADNGNNGGNANKGNGGGSDANCLGPKVNRPCVSTPDPVCGCDGKDYANPCAAEVAGVKSFVRGRCGGNGGNVGGGGDACKGPKINKACTSIFDPVCGCDGQTYSNECAAEVAGIKSFVPGECGKKGGNPSGGDDCIGKPVNKTCTSLFDPVCGCDGKTYSNACRAEAAGIKQFKQGECGGKGTGNPGKGNPGKGNPGSGTGDPGKGGNASGCGAIYQHISPETYDNREAPACKITIDMFPCENGAQTGADPVNNPKRVLLANEKIISPDSKCEDRSFFCVGTKLQVAQDSSGTGDLALLNDAYVKINEEGTFEVRTQKGRFLTGGVFGPTNAKGEVWATCAYKKKNYCMRMTWQKGQLDLRNNFTKK